MLDHITVTDLRADKAKALPFEIAFQAKVRHHGRHNTWLRQPIIGPPAVGNHRHQLITLNDTATLIDQNDAISIAIERNPNIGAQLANLVAQSLRLR
jgi:hypothetical protein